MATVLRRYYLITAWVLSQIHHALAASIVVGPTETPSGIETGTYSSGSKNIYLFDNVFLPTGRVTGLQVTIDTNVVWSPFHLQIYRAQGDPTTAENFTLIGSYAAENQLSQVVSVITFTYTDHIPVRQGDMYAILNTKTSSSLKIRFEATSNYTMLVADYAVKPAGSTIKFDRLLNTGPTFFKVKVFVDTSPAGECNSTGNNVCEQTCVDQPSGYICQCRSGYTLNEDNTTCSINQTCASHGNAACQQICVDTSVNYTCDCHAHWTLDPADNVSCIANVSGLFGPPGPKGNKGSPGATGAKGDKGSKGVPGPSGAQGEKGSKGPQGPKGSKGDKGTSGRAGNKGSTGPKGDKGDLGVKGNTGVKGSKGAKGMKGSQGLIGIKGSSGPKGSKGANGIKGQKGEIGLKGEKGRDGTSSSVGPKGNKGDKGNRGDQGVNGQAGTRGAKGQKGLKGATGPPFVAVDYCSRLGNPCKHYCMNTLQGHVCTCKVGFVLETDGVNCKDATECSVNNGGCHHTCVETTGSYSCSCLIGYVLGSDKHACIDINECASFRSNNCTSREVCVNVPGSFQCIPMTIQLTGTLSGKTCTRAEAMKLADCDAGMGIVSHGTVIGFIIWLITLTILLLVFLGCIMYKNKQKSEHVDDARGSRRSSTAKEDMSFYKVLPTAFYNYY